MKSRGPGVTVTSLTASEGRRDADYAGMRRYSVILGPSYLGKSRWFFVSEEATVSLFA